MTPEQRARDVVLLFSRDPDPDLLASLSRLVANAIRCAVAEEREACAAIAKAHQYDGGDPRDIGWDIAAAIRGRS